TAPVAAISPIIGGKALKGPADRMLASLGYGASAVVVAELYRDFLDVFVLDEQDGVLKRDVECLGINAISTQTMMTSLDTKRNLATQLLRVLQMAGQKPGGGAGRAR